VQRVHVGGEFGDRELADAREVAAAAEVPARAGQHDGAHRGIGFRRHHGVENLRPQLRRHRVTPLRPVHHDPCDAGAGRLDADQVRAAHQNS
jgi:hypothetical protein